MHHFKQMVMQRQLEELIHSRAQFMVKQFLFKQQYKDFLYFVLKPNFLKLPSHWALVLEKHTGT